MGKLIILRGNSGSGKTTAARALQQRFGPGTLLISHDTVRREMLNTSGAEGAEKSEPLMIHLLQYGKAHAEITILEGILPAASYRRLFEAAAAEFGTAIFAYYYDLPFAETLRRHATRPERAEFGEAEMRRWWKEKDFLLMLHEQILTPELSLEETVERIWQDVTASAEC